MAVKPLVSIYNVHESKWYQIGGTSPDIRCPSSYKGISSTVVENARNTQGQIVANPIQDDVAKIELSWNYLTVAEFAKLAKLFNPKYNGAFMVAVSFFNETKGDWEGDISSAPNNSTNLCRIFYPNDREGVVAEIALDKTTGAPIGYTGVSLNLIDTCRDTSEW